MSYSSGVFNGARAAGQLQYFAHQRERALSWTDYTALVGEEEKRRHDQSVLLPLRSAHFTSVSGCRLMMITVVPRFFHLEGRARVSSLHASLSLSRMIERAERPDVFLSACVLARSQALFVSSPS